MKSTKVRPAGERLASAVPRAVTEAEVVLAAICCLASASPTARWASASER